MSKSQNYSKQEELANVISHSLGVVLGIIALITLLITPLQTGNLVEIIAFSVYGLSVTLLFLASTIYHATTDPKQKALFKLLDHCAIYVLIAGSYTPLMLITLNGVLGYSMLFLIWCIAIGGIAFKIKFGHKYKKLSLVTYLGMGFISLAILQPLYLNLSTGGLILLATGGAIYTLGVFFYVRKEIHYTHAIWHLFVLAAAICHYLMMLYYV